jgi:hypothetical protein
MAVTGKLFSHSLGSSLGTCTEAFVVRVSGPVCGLGWLTVRIVSTGVCKCNLWEVCSSLSVLVRKVLV